MGEQLEVMWPEVRARLFHVRIAAREIEDIARELSALEDALDRATVWQPASGGMGGSAGGHSDPTARMAEKRMATLEALVGDKRTRLAELQREVGEFGQILWGPMARALTERHALAMELFYIDLADTWADVADEMGCSVRWVRQMRNEAYAWIDENCRAF